MTNLALVPCCDNGSLEFERECVSFAEQGDKVATVAALKAYSPRATELLFDGSVASQITPSTVERVAAAIHQTRLLEIDGFGVNCAAFVIMLGNGEYHNPLTDGEFWAPTAPRQTVVSVSPETVRTVDNMDDLPILEPLIFGAFVEGVFEHMHSAMSLSTDAPMFVSKIARYEVFLAHPQTLARMYGATHVAVAEGMQCVVAGQSIASYGCNHT